MLRPFLALLVALLAAGLARAEPWSAPDPELDARVEACRHEAGIRFLEGTDVLCYNSAIFPEQFLSLASLPEASVTIFTSPGGNVVTSQGLSRILDGRESRYVIAGPCMSACAMMLLPGLDNVYIHRSAHIAVHGATHARFPEFYGWLRGGAEPSTLEKVSAAMGYDFAWGLYNVDFLWESHLEGHGIELDFARRIAGRMMEAARAHECRVKLTDYWGMLDADYLRDFLGDRITGMEDFIQSYDDPRNYFAPMTQTIGADTYVFREAYEDAVCDGTPTTGRDAADELAGLTGDDDAARSGWQGLLDRIRAFEDARAAD